MEKSDQEPKGDRSGLISNNEVLSQENSELEHNTRGSANLGNKSYDQRSIVNCLEMGRMEVGVNMKIERVGLGENQDSRIETLHIEKLRRFRKIKEIERKPLKEVS